MSKATLKILPLGGVGEIGINCMVFETEKDLVLIDCGVQFPDASYPGVELFIPDLNYVAERLDKLRAVVVTHGHDDHIGAIPYLCDYVDSLDIYCTAFPKGLLTHKLQEHEVLDKGNFKEITPRTTFQIGEFEFDPIPVQHSIVEALGFAVKTPVGNVIHSGDFKHDPKPTKNGVIDFEPFKEWGNQGVQLLLSDSTNAERTGHTLSEKDIKGSFEKIFQEQTGRIIIALFASNIRRFENLLHLANSSGKKVAIVGRSMHLYSKLAHENKNIEIPEETLILAEKVSDYKDEDVVILATGSQAEPQSALVRMAYGTHPEIQIKRGDVVIMSSRFIPGNEKAITGMINQLYRLGANVLYESFRQVHVSGHGFQEELLLMLNACRPKFFIPIHGEYRHLSKHASLAEESGVASSNIQVVEDGQSLVLSEDDLTLGELYNLQPQAVLCGFPMETSLEVFSQRMGMAKAGIVFSLLMRQSSDKQLVGKPTVLPHGLLYKKGEEREQAIVNATQLVVDVHEEHAADPEIQERIRLELRRFFRKISCYKPIVISLVLDV